MTFINDISLGLYRIEIEITSQTFALVNLFYSHFSYVCNIKKCEIIFCLKRIAIKRVYMWSCNQVEDNAIFPLSYNAFMLLFAFLCALTYKKHHILVYIKNDFSNT